MLIETRHPQFLRSITARVLGLAFLCLLLLIPLSSVRGILFERQAARSEAAASIASGWGARQTMLGPVLVLQATCTNFDKDRAPSRSRRLAVKQPTSLEVTGSAETQTRHRGIHTVPVYRAKLRFELEIEPPALAALDWGCDETRVDAASVVLALSDLRGIDRLSPVATGADSADWMGGTPLPGVWENGLQAPLPIERLYPARAPLTLAFELDLRGSDRLALVPSGATTRFELAGDWPTPSFDGAFLPAAHRIDADGFRADWEVSGFARPIPSLRLDGTAPDLASSAFGVTWHPSVDGYQRTERSLKYGLLFVALTFLTFFLFELGGMRRAHPVQYGLVGGALCVFYLLLLSISEHAGFGRAYLVAAIVTTTQITLYGRAVIATPRRVAVLAGVLATLYGGLYLLVGLEEVALLIGSIGLFVVIAITMWSTRELHRAADPGEGDVEINPSGV